MADGTSSPVCVRLGLDEVEKLDALADGHSMKRSDFIRSLIRDAIRPKPGVQAPDQPGGDSAAVDAGQGRDQGAWSGLRKDTGPVGVGAGADEVDGGAAVEPLDGLPADDSVWD